MFMSNSRTLFHLRCRENLVKHRRVSRYYEADCRLLVRGFQEAHIKQFHEYIGLFKTVEELMGCVQNRRFGGFGGLSCWGGSVALFLWFRF